ncbi:hypothetical protein IE53DRAFT_371514 [Violaceomyces palustris]|uniref:Uncharacterized protein n=1 Tax=Violaceomyces palustris TaxID=1673888 RepID=A0ACD0NNN6_9BASI|nr:hypothetical protein IE53DRAFT_371514 [Violaceomyces palustris]
MSFLKKAQQQMAHTTKVPTLGNYELRTLQDIITTEKFFIQTNTKAAADFKKNAESLKTWAEEEGDDLKDVLGKISLLFDQYSTAQNRLNSHLSTIRLHYKSIRTREESLSDLKNRKRSLGSRIESVEKKLAKMGPENKELMKVTGQLKDMRSEMENLRVEVMEEEAAIGDFKRRTVKEALGLKCGGLLEMAEKVIIIAEIGKLMLEEIPLGTTRPGMPRAEYQGHQKTEALLQEATRCVADVGFAPSAPSNGIPRFEQPSRSNTFDQSGQGHDQSVRNDAQPDFPHAAEGSEFHSSIGYPGALGDSTSQSFNQDPSGASPSLDTSSTPIYASHASGLRGASGLAGAFGHEAQSSTFSSTEPLRDTAAEEWGRSAGAAIAGAGVGAVGADLEATTREAARNQGVHDTSPVPAGNAAASANTTPKDSGQTIDSQIEARVNSVYGGVANASEASPSRDTGYAAENVTSPISYDDHYNGSGAVSGGGGGGDGGGEGGVSGSNGGSGGGFGAPILPPVRATSPLPSSSADPGYSIPTTSSAPPPNGGFANTNNHQSDASYFQGIGSTRAMQESVRRSVSPAGAAGAGNRLSTVGLGGPKGHEPAAEGGRKMTAAAFRRGFSRTPSAQAMGATGSGDSTTGVPPVGGNAAVPDEPLATPQPPGAFTYGGPSQEDGGVANLSSSIPPLHIQKRHSQGQAVNSSQNISRYLVEQTTGSDSPAPPYVGEEDYLGGAGGNAGGSNTHHALPQPPLPMTTHQQSQNHHHQYQHQQQHPYHDPYSHYHPPPPQPTFTSPGYGDHPNGSRPGSSHGQGQVYSPQPNQGSHALPPPPPGYT